MDGALTGLGLYLLVRLRMFLGPIAGRKFGPWGRRGVWLVLILGMVLLAELNLLWLRDRLELIHADGVRWYYEAVYAVAILFVGLVLVLERVFRQRRIDAGKLADHDSQETNTRERPE